METKQYTALPPQDEKICSYELQESYRMQEYYFGSYERFLRYVADTYNLEKIAYITGEHLSDYIDDMKEREFTLPEIKNELTGIRFWHESIAKARYKLPPNSYFGFN